MFFSHPLRKAAFSGLAVGLFVLGQVYTAQGFTLVEQQRFRQVMKPAVTSIRLSDVTSNDAGIRIRANTFNIRQKAEQVTETMAGYYFALDQDRFTQLFGIFGISEETGVNTFSRLRQDVEKWSGNAVQRTVMAHTMLAAIPSLKGVADDSILKDLTDNTFGVFVTDHMDNIKKIAAVMSPVTSNVFIPVDMLVDELKTFGADVSSDYVWDVAEKNGWVSTNGTRKIIRADYFFGVWMGALGFYAY